MIDSSANFRYFDALQKMPLIAPIHELIAGELERIERYQEKGDLASVEEALDYLNER